MKPSTKYVIPNEAEFEIRYSKGKPGVCGSAPEYVSLSMPSLKYVNTPGKGRLDCPDTM
jgi:hypothetical protein